ncbi:DUF2380 domain-containing protein [Methylobacterium marchantiae]|uniref:DUF2380 domain-containing protein n=1 Tax=Methylobacterium marchantiae TaxID=600331 RepID=A0ABW3WUV5_9HYPH|nr:hypothetical protein AIGOOFII_1115 [Methylobacterium marchantiae]
MRTSHRSLPVAIGFGLLASCPCSADPSAVEPQAAQVLSAQALSAQALSAQALAMLPIRMLDTSGEPKDQTSEHAARLAAMAEGLSAGLVAEGRFRVAEISAESLARSCPDNAPTCILGAARKADAGFAFVGVIHKSSTLIMQIFARIVETRGGTTVFSRELNFRGDNDESWRRAEAFLLREIEADSPGGARAKK